MIQKTSIPFALIIFRFCLIPILIALAYFCGASVGKFLAVLVFLGVLSDFFDGVIARRLGVATDKLRRMDSQTDALFWLATVFSIYLIHPQLIIENINMIIILIITEICCYSLSFIKFKRETCTHSYLSKLWGLTLFLSLSNMLAFNQAGWLWNLCFAVGLISQIEVIAILLLLPAWNRDIKTAYHAWQIRKDK